MNTGLIARAVGVRAALLNLTWLGLAILLLGLTVSLLPSSTEAAPCTPGANCYCDRVKNGDLRDTALLMCEDFEAPTLRSATPVGGGAPYWGPPFDDTGFVGNRGHNGYWRQTYGNGVNGALWQGGTPANPTFGHTCEFSLCTGLGIWDATDRWQANSFALAAFLTDSDFSAEVPTINKPTGRAGGGSGAFDGAASFGQRVRPGSNAGITGGKFWGARTTFGITMAVAYPNNVLTSGLLNAPWKHNEWTVNTVAGDGLFLFHDGGGLTSTFPFYGFMFRNFSLPDDCATKLAAATKTFGTFSCNGNGIIWHPTNYNQATDWPLGTWGCVRGYYQNIGQTNSSIQIWFTGPSGVEKQVIGISGLNTTAMAAGKGPGYDGLAFNNYANANSGTSGYVPTTQTSFRYEDNIHIRAGAPVSCAQIGFGSSGGSADGVAPSTPGGLLAQ